MIPAKGVSRALTQKGARGCRDVFEPRAAEQPLRLCLPRPEPLITAPRTWY